MSEQEIKQVIAETTKLVEQWPPWKQNILNYSAQPTRSTPRPPIEGALSDELAKTGQDRIIEGCCAGALVPLSGAPVPNRKQGND